MLVATSYTIWTCKNYNLVEVNLARSDIFERTIVFDILAADNDRKILNKQR